MDRQDVLSDIRTAGDVERYHTWPTHQRQTVAAHTWQVLRIFLELWPEHASAPMIQFITFHDVAELVTGDLPYPIKYRYPGIREHLDKAELDANKLLGVELPPITGRQKRYFKIAEFLEMMEFGAVEMMLGNRYGQPVFDDCLKEVTKLVAELTDRAERERVLAYLKRRCAAYIEEENVR